MKRTPMLGLLIASCVTLSACASQAYTRPMALPEKQPPLECQTPCDRPPAMGLPREVWELEVLRWGFACKALHQDCVEANK